jgi:hypothetical protein
MFERTFGCYIMENAESRKLREEAMRIEGTLEESRNKMKLVSCVCACVYYVYVSVSEAPWTSLAIRWS